MIYFCSGTDSEKLEWFKTINIAGEKLTDQELRNAVYSGSWVTESKKLFSKNNCPAYKIANKYLNGIANRQEYLETAIDWISQQESITIENYMGQHQHDQNADELWQYFSNVINWVTTNFIKYRKEQKGIQWGISHNEYKNQELNSKIIENEINKLMQDEDVTNKKGIYEYILSRKTKYLNIQAFSDNQKREKYEKQNGICAICKNNFELEKMEADHITPWHEGGKTELNNCQLLCRECNRRKSGK